MYANKSYVIDVDPQRLYWHPAIQNTGKHNAHMNLTPLDTGRHVTGLLFTFCWRLFAVFQFLLVYWRHCAWTWLGTSDL